MTKLDKSWNKSIWINNSMINNKLYQIKLILLMIVRQERNLKVEIILSILWDNYLLKMDLLRVCIKWWQVNRFSHLIQLVINWKNLIIEKLI
jgi:hypothetical protein